MTGRRKWALKAFVTRWEIPWYIVTIALYAVALFLVVVKFPDVSNLWVSIFVLFGSFTASVGAMASAIKTADTPTEEAAGSYMPWLEIGDAVQISGVEFVIERIAVSHGVGTRSSSAADIQLLDRFSWNEKHRPWIED